MQHFQKARHSICSNNAEVKLNCGSQVLCLGDRVQPDTTQRKNSHNSFRYICASVTIEWMNYWCSYEVRQKMQKNILRKKADNT